jgi:hypothetical protein
MDRDGKFCPKFCDFFENEGVNCVKLVSVGKGIVCRRGRREAVPERAEDERWRV